MELRQAFIVRQGTGGEIPHEDAGHHDLISREPQQESQQDKAIQAHQRPQGLKDTSQAQQDALPADIHIGCQPDQQPRRGGHRYCTAQDEQRPVEDGPHQYLPHLGRPVGRQLQGEG